MDETPVLEGGERSVALRVQRDPSVLGARVRTDAAARLTSIHVATFRVEVPKDSPRGEQLTCDVPNVSGAAREALDERGVVIEGTRVGPGDILVGQVQAAHVAHSDDARLQRAMHGAALGPVHDVSLTCPPDAKGVVTRVDWRESSTHQHVHVEVTDRRPLRIGDVLAVDGEKVVVSAIVREQPAELHWSGAEGTLPVAKVTDAESALEARSIGPYSLVTQQPLGGKASLGGQRITDAQLRALERGGAWHAAHEMLTIKNADATGRTRLYEGIVRGDTRFEAGAPETRHVLLRELEALGFSVEGTQAPVEETAPPSSGGFEDIFSFFEKPRDPPLADLRIRLCSSDQIRERSHGAVDRPETIDAQTLAPVDGGLFCARTFGPVRDYACLCGRCTRMKHRGMVCEECGVEVVHSKVRRERFGHLELPAPLLHPFAREILAELLGRPVADVDAIVDQGLTLELGEPTGWRDGGVMALHEAAGERGAHLFFTAWPVLPPDLRPIVPLRGGRFATSDLNDLYRSLINRRNRMARLLELDAPALIVRRELVELQRALEALVQNGRRVEVREGPEQRILVSLSDLVTRRFGHRPESSLVHGRRVDYSGAAAVVPQDLPETALLLPRGLALEVFKPWIFHRLEALGHATTIRASKVLVDEGRKEALEALETGVRHHPVLVGPQGGERLGAFDVRLWDELAIGMAPARMEALGLDPGAVAAVFVPLSGAAIRETRALGVAEPVTDDPPRGWLGEVVLADDVPAALLRAALREAVDPLEDRRVRRLLGLIGRPDADPTEDDQRSWDDPAPPKTTGDPVDPRLQAPIEELSLAAPIVDHLRELSVETVGQLVRFTDLDLLKTRRFGRPDLRELKGALADRGLSLGMSGT